jgi:YD repeat-containing protein
VLYDANLAGRLSIVTFPLYQKPGDPRAGKAVNAPYINYYYSYNAAGRLLGQTMQRYNGTNAFYFGLSSGYDWDNQGRLSRMAYPGGTYLVYNYDAISRLSSITETLNGSTWTAAAATYNSANLMTNLT